MMEGQFSEFEDCSTQVLIKQLSVSFVLPVVVSVLLGHSPGFCLSRLEPSSISKEGVTRTESESWNSYLDDCFGNEAS